MPRCISREPGQLLHRIRHSLQSARRLRSQDPHPQFDPQLLLSWASHHVLPSLARQSAPRVEMWLHARVYQVHVRVRHNLHDRRGVSACVQGHPERCAGGVTSDSTERFVYKLDLYGRGTLVGGYAWVVHCPLLSSLFTFALCFRFIDG
jgi:hypothetical protein